MSQFKSIVDLINENEASKHDAAAETAAATELQQKLMEQAGELVEVSLIGPNGNFIPAYFSKAENAFLPKFRVDD